MLVYCITKKADLTDEGFFHYWKNIHGPIGGHIPHLRRSVQIHRLIVPGDKYQPGYDGMAHDDPNYVVVNLAFSSREQAQAFLDHPAMRQAWKRFLGWEAETLTGGSHLRSRLGAEQFQARILDEIERVDY